MPAKSKAQQRLFAIAKHHPEQLYARNKAVAQAPASVKEEFASTKVKGKPQHVKRQNRYGQMRSR
jgi:hypothetical protein